MAKLIIWEWVIIFVAMLSLWPWLMGYRAPWYGLVQLAFLLALLWVARNRWRRTRQAVQENNSHRRNLPKDN